MTYSCTQGCGRELPLAGAAATHSQRCWYPRTLERLLELLVIVKAPAPSHVSHLDDCWMPTKKVTKTGYSKPYRAVYATVHGGIPVDKPNVLHHCDNNPCCNPTHLYAGTISDNTQDMLRRGRANQKSFPDWPLESQLSSTRKKKAVRRSEEHKQRASEKMKQTLAARPELVQKWSDGAAAGRTAKANARVVTCRCGATGSVDDHTFKKLGDPPKRVCVRCGCRGVH